MKKTTFIGIDIASENFVIHVQRIKSNYEREIENSPEGFQELESWLKKLNIRKDLTLIVLEATGTYNHKLCNFLHTNGYTLAVENPKKVKKAFDLSKKKNDWIDAKRISDYARIFKDDIQTWEPADKVFEDISSYLGFRESLVCQRTKHKNQLHALSKKQSPCIDLKHHLEEIIKYLNSEIRKCEKKIENLLISEKELRPQYYLLKSISSFGLLLSAELIVLTRGFENCRNYKQIAAYLGICPLERSSGKYIPSKRSDGQGPSRIRKLLAMAATSSLSCNLNLKKYHARKKLEGKPWALIRNNICNKLLKTACAIVDSGKSFNPNYISVQPLTLM